jgi:hypothetical protein
VAAAEGQGAGEAGVPGEQPPEPYIPGENEKATGPDPNRVDPITPATGAQQTPFNSNQNVSIQSFANDVKKTMAEHGPAAVFGDANERANMGKGADDPHAYEGPYDYPTYPGGKANTDLTRMGSWRTNNGNTSHLYFGTKNSNGLVGKTVKYHKWSSKNGGVWKKLTKSKTMNILHKPSRMQGGNIYLPQGAGTSLPAAYQSTLLLKEGDHNLADKGAEKMEENKEAEGGGALEGDIKHEAIDERLAKRRKKG